jgi:hypothetical protein
VRDYQAARLSAGAVTASKDLYSVRKETFCGKQIFLRCSGPSASRFYQICLRLSDSECTMIAVNGESTYQCDSCRMKQRAARSDDAPRRSAAKADYDGDVSLTVTFM